MLDSSAGLSALAADMTQPTAVLSKLPADEAVPDQQPEKASSASVSHCAHVA